MCRRCWATMCHAKELPCFLTLWGPTWTDYAEALERPVQAILYMVTQDFKCVQQAIGPHLLLYCVQYFPVCCGLLNTSTNGTERSTLTAQKSKCTRGNDLEVGNSSFGKQFCKFLPQCVTASGSSQQSDQEIIVWELLHPLQSGSTVLTQILPSVSQMGQ